MADSRSSDGEQIIEVTFNQQQYIAIEKLRAEAQFGANSNLLFCRMALQKNHGSTNQRLESFVL